MNIWDELSRPLIALRYQFVFGMAAIDNGDFLTRKQVVYVSQAGRADGTRMGRGVSLGSQGLAINPVFFGRWEHPAMLAVYIRCFQTERVDEKPFDVIKEFCKLFIPGWNGSTKGCERLMRCSNLGEEMFQEPDVLLHTGLLADSERGLI